LATTVCGSLIGSKQGIHRFCISSAVGKTSACCGVATLANVPMLRLNPFLPGTSPQLFVGSVEAGLHLLTSGQQVVVEGGSGPRLLCEA
jgi:hypothetical protein